MSNKYIVVSDSCGDLPPNLAEGIEIIPYIYTLDGKDYYSYPDYREQPVKDFYNLLRAGKMASTTQVTPQRYVEVWEPMLQEGNDILYICLSSMLSKSYEMSQMAAMELKEKYPDRNIITIDSKSACMGIGLLAVRAAKTRDDGKSLDENAAYIKELVNRTHHWVMADDLHHLRRGGRVSGAAAFVGSMLSVKPILSMKEEGKLEPLHKARGRDKAFAYIMAKLEELKYNPAEGPIYIAHSDVPEYASQMQDMIKAKYGYKDFVLNHIGPVIGAHTGPGTIALIFAGKEKRPV
ncbi:MAG: DegV family protein [Defluviitaleaceae bacterium]|nr:DegV family protein [Defluviitaleaceae bacterium]